MERSVVIDCFPESAVRYRHGYAVVAVDVIRATTTAITAAASGRRCFPVPTIEMAFGLAQALDHPLLAGEQKGIMPMGFDLNNSPTELLARKDVHRPVVLLSSSGTRLCYEASKCQMAFLACLRNYVSAAHYLAQTFSRVAVIGAGTRGEFREEDQMCCAWLAENMLTMGYTAGNRYTLEVVRRWSGKPPHAWSENKSASYLKASGQSADFEFVLSHQSDLTAQFVLQDGEVIMTDDPSGLSCRRENMRCDV
ncbi:MAG: 2-phosphosulfolactate phosphatase [Candidatus Binataceae bacterium]|nr:2-phosphosulfolactate phosphatase [Candidatus Binataceae bacterium]